MEKVKARASMQAKVKTRITKKGERLTISQRKEISIKMIYQLAKETNSKCYMLSFNKPDGRKYGVDNIIAELLKNGYFCDGQIVHALKNSFLFLSSYNLPSIQKFIHNSFSDLKFILVRLNRSSFPALKYCY